MISIKLIQRVTYEPHQPPKQLAVVFAQRREHGVQLIR